MAGLVFLAALPVFGYVAVTAFVSPPPETAGGLVVPSPTTASPSPTASTPSPVARARPRQPVRVVVPVLGIDSPVVPIDTRDGVLIPPDDPQVLGWWKHGVKTGDDHGSILVTGHSVHTGGGAFDDLDQLDEGDIVRVGTKRRRHVYVVVDVTYYPKKTLASAAERVFRQDGDPRLVLITCDDWDGTDYRGNTVVIAEPQM